MKKINYIYYDPELHWCKICTKFPKTAQDYLNHLHSKEHLEKTASRKSDAPWRPSFQKLNEVPSHPDAQTKRAPIKGLQFFEPTNAWFCKLCEMFMGDSWCSSLHLKSAIHAERYAVSILLFILNKFNIKCFFFKFRNSLKRSQSLKRNGLKHAVKLSSPLVQ